MEEKNPLCIGMVIIQSVTTRPLQWGKEERVQFQFSFLFSPVMKVSNWEGWFRVPVTGGRTKNPSYVHTFACLPRVIKLK